MRRNMPMGQRAAPPSGPLMTDHLKLQDLDLELELLKRKREIIEQQQQVLTNERLFNNRQRQYEYGYNQPGQSYQRSHLEMGQQPNLFQNPSAPNYSGGLLGKRPPNVPEWTVAPKRFSGPQGGNKRKFGASPGPQPKGRVDPWAQPLRPLMDQFVAKPNHPAPRPMRRPPPSQTLPKNERRSNPQKLSDSSRKDFKPARVTRNKPSLNAADKLLSSGPATHRKKLAQEMARSSLVQQADNTECFVLRPDVVPSQQLAGRLELALGNILKQVKIKFGDKEPHIVSFQSQFLLRRMKQAIRERLRTAMLNKPVGKVDETVRTYREVFPPETDVEIVQVAQEAQRTVEKKHFAIRLHDAETPEKYFKNNMDKLLGRVLNDMFEKIKTMYENIPEEMNVDDNKNIDLTKDDDDVKENADGVKVETEANKRADAQEVEADIQDKEKVTMQVKEEETERSDSTNITTESKESNKTGSNDNPAESHLNRSIKIDEQAREVNKLETLVCKTMMMQLPEILPKYKETIIQILDLNDMYRITKERIVAKLKDKLNISTRVEEFEKANESEKSFNETLNNTTDSTTSAEQLDPPAVPYCVKVFARPVLPKRKIMHQFLREFKPRFVKKHKNMHLLFVGFTSKDNFERILAVKETTIANSVITIKVSEKAYDPTNNDVQIIEDGNEVDLNSSVASDESVLNKELDSQISDLLSSIRQEEEKAQENEVQEISEAPTTTEDSQEADAKRTDDNENEKANEDASNGKIDESEILEDKTEGNDTSTEKTGGIITSGENFEITEISDDTNEVQKVANDKPENEESKDKVEALKGESKESGRATPTRSSSRLASVTPSTIRTRRASRLAQN